MTLYRYVKAEPVAAIPQTNVRAWSLLFMTLGGGLLLWALWPILSFMTISDAFFPHIVSPVSDARSAKSTVLSPVAFAASPELTGSDALTNANLWYPTVPQKHVVTPVNTYTLSIPKLKINTALVTIAGDDLDDSLVHYGGTGLPGQYGTAVVFGHSTLPQFYSPTNYKSIFSLLPSLKIGDEIDVSYDGVQYRYLVYDMEVLDPTDLSVLEQQLDDSYLTLVTCVPPGTMWKRLNVKAKLSQ